MLLLNFNVNAGLLDNASAAFFGHINDIQSRFSDDQFISGSNIKTGKINENALGMDAIHNGKGSISLIQMEDKYFIQLESDFYSSPGPDYYVYVSNEINIQDENDFYSSKQVEVGMLLKGSGASFYEVSSPQDINSVTIMCKKFREFIASADLT